ncbi:MAG: hypothetical protein ACREBG_00655 [Pyrinomonadaceae bacterium]
MSKCIAKELTGALLFLSILIPMTALPASSQEGLSSRELPEGAEYLPPGEARKLMLQGCVQCHNLVNSVSQRKTRVAWRRTVNEMIWRGAPLLADEAETITNYLAVSFGPDKPLPEALKTKPAKGEP